MLYNIRPFSFKARIRFILFPRKSRFGRQSLFISVGTCARYQGHATHENTLLAMRLMFPRQENRDVKQVSVGRSLRFRRDHNIYSNACLSRVGTLQVAGGLL